MAASVLLAVLALLPAAGHALAATQRSVLLVIADDFGVDASAFYPTSAARRATKPPAAPTPNLTRLAKAGVMFRQAWATPVCSPSRATIFTGRYSFRTGLGSQIPEQDVPHPELPAAEFSLPEAFKAGDAPHLLAHIGKWHLSRGLDDPNLQGWPHFAGPDPDYAKLPDYYSYRKVVDGVVSQSTTYVTTEQVDDALAVIRDAKAQARPYFVWLALSAPHAPYQKPPNALHSKDSLPATGATRRAYYDATIEAMDTEIGRLVKEVDLKTTTLIFVADNGTPKEVTASPYNPSKAKGTVYEGGVRVPLFVTGAEVAAPGRVVSRIVNSVDLYPTILQLAGLDPTAVVPKGVRTDGVSFLPYLKNQVGTSLRKFIFTETFPLTFDKTFERAVANCCYKLIERAVGTREFFDLKNDPYETKNLLKGSLSSAQKSSLATLDLQLDQLIATAAKP